MMNLEQAKQVFLEELTKIEDFDVTSFEDEWDSNNAWYFGESFEGESDKVIKFVHSFGGEGLGDTRTVTYKIEHPEFGLGYVEFSGYYDSWNGTDWNDKYMVWPEQQTITVYALVKPL